MTRTARLHRDAIDLVLAPADSAVEKAPTPAVGFVVGIAGNHRYSPLGAAADHDHRLADLGLVGMENGEVRESATDLDQAQVRFRVVEERGAGISDAIQVEQCAHGVADMLRGQECVRGDRRSEISAPATLKLPAAVGQGTGRCGGVMLRIAGGIENDGVERAAREQPDQAEGVRKPNQAAQVRRTPRRFAAFASFQVAARCRSAPVLPVLQRLCSGYAGTARARLARMASTICCWSSGFSTRARWAASLP